MVFSGMRVGIDGPSRPVQFPLLGIADAHPKSDSPTTCPDNMTEAETILAAEMTCLHVVLIGRFFAENRVLDDRFGIFPCWICKSILRGKARTVCSIREETPNAVRSCTCGIIVYQQAGLNYEAER
jgi:hypothetical protein